MIFSSGKCCAGVGLRRSLIDDVLTPAGGDNSFHFLETAPENWIGLGGQWKRKLRQCSERYPLILHGLSLNLGGIAPLDTELITAVSSFIKEHQCPIYSEHLSCCGDQTGHLYDLMPIPFTPEAASHTASRIRQVQDMLGQTIAVENSSYYAAPGQEMSEAEFITMVLNEADCKMLLDVNNVYVNSINHHYDPVSFLHSLPNDRVAYYHVAGHYVEAEDLRVDTHGAAVISEVWELLPQAYEYFGIHPTLVERDFNIPPFAELLLEVKHIKDIQHNSLSTLS